MEEVGGERGGGHGDGDRVGEWGIAVRGKLKEKAMVVLVIAGLIYEGLLLDWRGG